MAHPPHMRMTELGNELENMRLGDMRHGPPEAWAEEFRLHHPHHQDAEFERIYQMQNPQHADWADEFQRHEGIHRPQLRPAEVEEFERLYQSVSSRMYLLPNLPFRLS